MKPTISIIAALDEKRGIGRNNELPWHIPGDLARFKELTMGHPVIMGRKTFESIVGYLGKPLPGRNSIVITRDPGSVRLFRSGIGDKAIYLDSVTKAIEFALNQEHDEIFIIGGAQIFEQSLPLADKLYLTLVAGDYNCDTFFPDYSRFKVETFREAHPENDPSFTWLDLKR